MPTKKATKKTVKKTAKKKAAKKVAKKTTKKTAKKAAQKSDARVLVCANGEACFWTSDGQILQDLTELRDALTSMADEVYSHHVTRERNDFADWVEHVLEDTDCATALRKSRKPASAHTVVVRHLRYYNV